jgi:hypothetical protein
MRIFFLVLLVVEVSATMLGGVWALIASDALSPSQVVLPVVFFAYRGAAVWRPRWLQA